jgi:hypothetical protein
LASFFGVGYATFVKHLTWSLGAMDSHHCDRLTRIHPKELKESFGGTPESEVVLVDTLWQGRAVDLEIGDLLVLPRGVHLDEESKFQELGSVDNQAIFRALGRGYARAIDGSGEWAVNVRVAPKHFEGLARFRFYEDIEEEVNS